MPIDPNIALGFRPAQIESPVNQLAQVLQIQGAQNQNRLADLQFQQHKQQQDEARNLNALYAKYVRPDGTIDEAGLMQGAAQSNMGSKIPVFRKQFAESAEAKAKADKQGVDLVDAKLKQSRQFLDGVTTPEQFLAWHEGNHKDPVLGPMLASRGITAEQSRAKIMQAMQTPGGLQQLINESKLGAEKFIELNKPSYQTQSSGDQTSIIALPGLGGAPTTVSQATIKESEPQRLAREQQAAEAAKGRAVTIRGQNMTDSRAREANKAGGKAGPMSVTLQKELLESDDVSNSSDAVIKTLTAAKEKSKDAYSGYFAKGRAVLASNLPGDTPGADATIDLDNMMTGQALESLKLVFGGMPTEGERKILLDMQASADKTPKQREAIMDRAIAAAKVRGEFSRAKAKSIREGSYLTDGVPAAKPPAPAGAPAVGAVENGYRFKGGNPADAKSWEKV